MKLCLIYNYAQHYRTSIFKLIDQEFDCDFFFGDSYLDVKKMDYSLLKGSVKECHTRRFGSWHYMQGVIPLLKKDYDCFILLGETHSLSTWLFCVLSRLLYPQKRVYFWSHGWYGKETRLERWVKKFFFKLPNGGVFLYGNYAKELMINEGINPNKLYVIHNSLAYEEQVAIRSQLTESTIYYDHFGNNNHNLIFVGRLTVVKKLEMLLQALCKLKSRGQQYNLVFIGGGESKESLELLSYKLGLNEIVWFFGPCYDETVLGELIYNADLCVAPGNVGLTAMHTMVFGTPVLTHNDFAHQMPEFEAVIEGETGSFFQYGNVDSLVESITGWFDEKGDKRDEVRRSCMREIETSWTPQYQIRVIKKVIEQ